jgi:hypothetical protein
MPYEIFVSYSRQAPGICREVRRLLEEQLGYTGAVFVDTWEIPGGAAWAHRIENVLREVQYVVLLATKEAVAKPDFIRKELAFAQESGSSPDIIPVEFDRGASKSLLGEGTRQYIRAGRDGDALLDAKALEKRLRSALTQRTMIRLEEHRKDARAWAQENLPSPSFWESLWEGFFTHGDPVAIVAPAGRGKSVIAAHRAQQALRDSRTWPVVLRPEMVAEGIDALARDLGARGADDLPARLQVLQEHDRCRIVFIVDGLDQVRLVDDPDHARTVGLLRCLSQAAQLVVTCRDDVWESAYAARLPFETVVPGELADSEVARVLPSGAGNPLLRTPFFLDLALRRRDVWGSIPKTDVAFLRRLFRGLDSDGGGVPDGTGPHRRAILHALAARQLEELTYEVRRSVIEADLNMHPSVFRKALGGLKDDGLLLERTPTLLLDTDQQPTLRLAHDLLDCFSMASVVYSANERYDAALRVCQRSERECGWSVLAMLVRLGTHHEDDQLLRTLFGEFLRTLDRKRLASSHMARAWAITYVLREQLPSLLPLILEALAGRPAKALVPGDGAGNGSRLGDDARLTQEAASSVASAFLGLKAGRLVDATRVVPVLKTGLRKWELKGRFIDALARYETPEAREILVGFGNELLDTRVDLPCLRYVAEGLRRFEPDVPLIELLERIAAADDDVDPITRRRAYQALEEHDQRAVPERDEAEIVYGLAVLDEQGRPSDWRIVHEYALYVRDQATIHRRRFGPEVCRALVASMQHIMLYVSSPAAAALGCFDDPMARDALLDQLITDVLPAEIRDSCLQALERQQERLTDPAERQLYRLLLMYTARIAADKGSAVTARRLTELAMADAGRDGWLADPETLQVVPPWPLAEPVAIRTQVREGPPVEAAVEAAMRDLHDLDTGPDLEAKFRFTHLAYQPGSGLEVTLAPTSWSISKRFSTALQRDPTRIGHTMAGTWIQPMPLGNTVLPGIAVVHGIVLTSDGQVLMAQRSAKVGYAPLHWSASFEEQLNGHDLDTGTDPFIHAACRGFHEEFGCDVDASRVTLLSAVLQIDLLNIGLVFLLRPDSTSTQIEQRWADSAPDRWEAKQLGWLPEQALDEVSWSQKFHPLHVTSRLRCELLRRWISDNPGRVARGNHSPGRADQSPADEPPPGRREPDR